MGFKELEDLLSTQNRSDPENLTGFELERRVSAKDRASDGCHLICCFLVLPSLDAPGVSDNRCPSKPRLQLFPTKRRLPDDLVRQRKRLQTDLLRQSCPDLMRFRHAPPSVRVPTSENSSFMERPGEIRRVPEGSSSSLTGPRFTEPARRCARKKQERTCVQSEDSTRGDRTCETRSSLQPTSDLPTLRASPSVQAPSVRPDASTTKRRPSCEYKTHSNVHLAQRAAARPYSHPSWRPPKSTPARPRQPHSMVAECCAACSRPLCVPNPNEALTVHLSLTYEPASRSKGGGQAGQLHQNSSHATNAQTHTPLG